MTSSGASRTLKRVVVGMVLFFVLLSRWTEVANFHHVILQREVISSNDLLLDGVPLEQISMTRTAVNTSPLKNQRRRKAHWCYHYGHNGRPTELLQKEFGFETAVNAQLDPCGNTTGKDWKMETGLNAHLNQQGWDTLKLHQVWFPCMGCKDSYCNKTAIRRPLPFV